MEKETISKLDNIFTKLLEVQKKVGAITKGKENPFFKSKYADINDYINTLKPILNEVGLVVIQPLVNIDNQLAIKTIIIDPSCDDKFESIAILPVNPDPQKMGSIITYFRRYALQSLFFLQAEDDDANCASNNAQNAQHTNNYAKPINYVAPQATGSGKVKCKNFATCGNEHDPKFKQCWNCGQQATNAPF